MDVCSVFAGAVRRGRDPGLPLHSPFLSVPLRQRIPDRLSSLVTPYWDPKQGYMTSPFRPNSSWPSARIIRLLLESGFLWGSDDLVCRVVRPGSGYRKEVREAFARTILQLGQLGYE